MKLLDAAQNARHKKAEKNCKENSQTDRLSPTDASRLASGDQQQPYTHFD